MRVVTLRTAMADRAPAGGWLQRRPRSPAASHEIGVPVAGVGVWRSGVTRVSTQRSLPARPRNVRNCGRDPSSLARFPHVAGLRSRSLPLREPRRGCCSRPRESEPERVALVGPEPVTYGQLAALAAAVAAEVARLTSAGRPGRDHRGQRDRVRRRVSRRARRRRGRGPVERRFAVARARHELDAVAPVLVLASAAYADLARRAVGQLEPRPEDSSEESSTRESRWSSIDGARPAVDRAAGVRRRGTRPTSPCSCSPRAPPARPSRRCSRTDRCSRTSSRCSRIPGLRVTADRRRARRAAALPRLRPERRRSGSRCTPARSVSLVDHFHPVETLAARAQRQRHRHRRRSRDLRRLARARRRRPRRADAFATVRLCVSGATTLSRQTAAAMHERFGVVVHDGYGLTEASPVVTTTAVERRAPARFRSGRRSPASRCGSSTTTAIPRSKAIPARSSCAAPTCSRATGTIPTADERGPRRRLAAHRRHRGRRRRRLVDARRPGQGRRHRLRLQRVPGRGRGRVAQSPRRRRRRGHRRAAPAHRRDASSRSSLPQPGSHARSGRAAAPRGPPARALQAARRASRSSTRCRARSRASSSGARCRRVGRRPPARATATTRRRSPRRPRRSPPRARSRTRRPDRPRPAAGRRSTARACRAR